MQKSINRQSGFAIGTILLAVVLIAAIVSAIAIASRGSTQQGNREQARVNATTIMNQGINYQNAFNRIVANGTLPETIVASNDTGTAGLGDGNTSTVGTNGALAINFTTGTNCLAADGDPCIHNAVEAQAPPRNGLVATPPAGVRYAIRQLTVGDGTDQIGTTASEPVLLLSGVERGVCQNINNVSTGGGIPVGDDIDAAGRQSGVAVVFTNAAGGQDLVTPTAFTVPRVNNAPLQEGCVRQQAVAGQYMYYRVLQAR
jgi:type II secretory pathway pseudopilin PulG